MTKRTKLPTYIAIGITIYALLLILLVQIENGAEGSNLKSLDDAVWYSLVTLTTVGYGDRFPVTTTGRLIGFAFLLGSLGILGFLIGEINKNLIERRERRRMGFDGTTFKGHIVIVGWNDFARSITRQLIGADRQVAIITNKKDDIDLIYEGFPNKPVFVLFTELNNISQFNNVNIQESFVVFLNAGDDTDKLISILNLKKQFPNLQYLVTLDNPDLKDTFQSAGVTYALSKNEIASKLIASFIFEPDVAAFSNDLMSSTESAGHFDLQQYRVLEKNPFANKTYGDAFWDIKKNYGSLLLGIAKPNGSGRELHKLPADDTKVEVGDYLIVITDGVGEQKLSESFGTKEGVM